ncbi:MULTISPECIES: DUF6876 family protein [Acetobacter]|uniref:DUF6876 domain-containing protein n=1 Tax=Acetobacter ascendens TaxID=481146 RepID=A0A1Y0V6V3_9PROT|nr:DUF6876 family protein [Acetobacter ascendens]ARW11806.1 hypothetical protein S101447_02769 [Acetobacter ascendens]KDE19250.1 hypothetical protein AZ09_13185 [Acetobacter aceti 1023]
MSETLEPTHAITSSALAGFTGTVRYYRWHSGLLLTDGAHYLAANGAAWLIDVLASVQYLPAMRAEERQFWTLQVDLEKHAAVVVCTDGDKTGEGEIELYRQEIPYTDFPLNEAKLFAFREPGMGRVVLLPSEY